MLKIFLFILAVVACNYCYAQADSLQILQQKFLNAQSDSLKIDAAFNLHNAYFKTDPEKSYYYANEILVLGKKTNSAKYISKGYRGLARCERKKRSYDAVLHYDTLALNYAVKYGDLTLINSQQIQLVRDYLDAEKLGDAFEWLIKSKPVVDKLNQPKIHAEWYKLFAYYYRETNQHKKAIPYYNKAIDAFINSNDAYNTAETRVFLAQSLTALGKTDSVPALLFEALDTYTKRNSQSRMAFVNELLGDAFCTNGDIDRGIQHYLQAKNLYAISNNQVEEALCLPSLARAYMLKKNYAEAKNYIVNAEQLFNEMNYEIGKIRVQTLWGQYYSETSETDKAESYFINAAQMLNAEDLPEAKTQNERYWSQNEYRRKNIKKADSLVFSYTSREAATKEPEVIAQELKMIKKENKNLDSNSIKILSLLYVPGGSELLKKEMKEQGLYKVLHADSLLNLSSFSNLNAVYDSTMTTAYNNQLLNLETKYKTRLKDDSLRIANQNALLAASTIKKQNSIIAFAAMIALLLGVGFFLQYKNRKRAERDKAKIELLQHEIHHRVKNNLGIIKRFVEVAEKSGAQNLSLTSLKNRIAAIELLHKNLYQSVNTGEVSLQTYLEQLVKIVNSVFVENEESIAVNVNAPVKTNMATAEKIGLIINELLTNSFKHGFKNKTTGEINITANKINQEKFTLNYKENGVGYNAQKAVKGYGSKLIEGIANELKAAFEMNTENGVDFNLTV